MKKKILSVVLCAAMICGIMGGCGKSSTDEPANNSSADNQTTVEQTNPENNNASSESEESNAPVINADGMMRSYLTGEWVDPSIGMNRPVAIMFENTSVVQPTYNSSKASMYVEIEAEGGITRIMEFFEDYSDMDRIGNVRSTRPYFVYLANSYDALLLHCGGAIEAYTEIFDLGLANNLDINRECSQFAFRASDCKAPHNLFIDTEGIDKAIDYKGYDRTHDASYGGNFKFNEDDANEIVPDGEDAAVVVVYQSNPKPWFEYNEEDGLYYRYEFGSKQMDKVTGEQLAVKNIIIQETQIAAYYDEQNHDRVDVDIVGKGNGKYITNGKAIDITWSCSGNGEVTHYYDLSGNEIVLNQGKTWIDITDVDYTDRNKIYATYDEYKAAK